MGPQEIPAGAQRGSTGVFQPILWTPTPSLPGPGECWGSSLVQRSRVRPLPQQAAQLYFAACVPDRWTDGCRGTPRPGAYQGGSKARHYLSRQGPDKELSDRQVLRNQINPNCCGVTLCSQGQALPALADRSSALASMGIQAEPCTPQTPIPWSSKGSSQLEQLGGPEALGPACDAQLFICSAEKIEIHIFYRSVL